MPGNTSLLPASLLLTCVLAPPALTPATHAQHSDHYKLEESVLNAGGHPAAGEVLASGSFRMTLDALGEGVITTSTGMSGDGYHSSGGFATAFLPPGEVHGLHFSDTQTLAWNPEASTGAYHLYRDLLSTLSGLAYGQCEQYDLIAPTTTDADPVPPGDGFFYLVTAANRLAEEGTKGHDSLGYDRSNADPCP